MKLTFNLIIDTSTGEFEVVNTETGETKSVKTEVKKKTSRKKKDNDPIPKLTLESNKYSLNSAAVDLMGVEPDDRLDIKMEKQGKNLQPVIGNDLVFKTHKGNRVTKSFTVACRGKANDELSKYGSVFVIEPHPSKEGLFILVNRDNPENTGGDFNDDDNLELPSEDFDYSDNDSDASIGDLLEDDEINYLLDNDSKTDEVSAFDFNL